jgi:tetratricopeptide (TPR) repeat protein/predicted Ser/Thr protein kinase
MISRRRGCYDADPTMAESPPASQPIESAPDDDDLSDVDSDVRAFVRDLGLPGRSRGAGHEELAAGTKVAAHLEVLRVLGRGGVGVVYLARDTRLRRDVAVKLVQASSPSAAARLEREAQAMARLTHPNVVTVHEVGAFSGEVYIAMEYVEGGTLRRWLAEAPRTWTEIVEVFVQAAHGLHAAHAAGLLHRDFKPDNVLIGHGRVRVGDFGLARSGPPGSSGRASELASIPDDALAELTATHGIVGTPAYLAPEVVLRREVGPLADQFALGVSLFEALCGQRPYPPPGAWTASEATMGRPDPALPSWLRAVVQRAVALEPSARFADVGALAGALEHGLGRAARRRRTIAVGAIALLAVVGGIGLGTTMQARACSDLAMPIDDDWNASRRDQIATAFRATGSPLAEPALAELTGALDGWSDAWKAERRDACEATHVHGEQSEARMDLRMDCLHRARLEIEARIAVFRDADAEVVARTEALLFALPDPSQCGDPQALDAGDVVPPERREVYDPLLAAVLAAEQRSAAGRKAKAREALDGLIATLEAEDFPWLGARARLARGLVLTDVGQREAAVADLVQAHALALRTGDRALLGQVLLNLAGTLGRTSAGTEEALRLLVAAEAAAESTSFRTVDRVDLDALRVEVLQFGDRFADAEREAREALSAASADHPRRPRLLTMLALSIDRQYRREEALAVHRQAVTEAEALRGPEHPVVAAALGNLASTLAELRRNDEALEVLRRVVAIREAALGPEAPSLGETHRQIGDTLRQRGDLTAADAEYERALAIHRAAGDEAGIVFALSQLASLRNDLAGPAAAKALLLEALPLAERQFGSASMNVARIELNLAGYRNFLNELEPARAHGERALALIEAAKGPDDPLVAGVLANLGRTVAQLGEVEEGLAMLERAGRILAATLPAEAIEHAGILGARADVLVEVERWQEAADLREEVLAHHERSLGPDHPTTMFVRFLYGRDLVAAGRHAEAVPQLERCLADVVANPASVTAERPARIRWLLAEASWPDRRARARARELSREALADLEPLQYEKLAELKAWMAARDISP